MTHGEYMTVAEAAYELGYSGPSKVDTVRKACKEGRLECDKNGPIIGGHKSWRVSTESVEEILKLREFNQRMKAEGKKWCGHCQTWKERTDFWKGQKWCRGCATEERRKASQRKAKEPKSYSMAGWVAPQAFYADIQDCFTWAPPPRPEDSLRYPCMTVGFALRPIPIGQTKREAFCAKCEAVRCVHLGSVEERRGYGSNTML